MRWPARVALLAVALAALVALSGAPAGTGAPAASGAPASDAPAAAAGPAGGAPWETAGPFPSSYDLRTARPGYDALSPVRSQDNFSTCWAMSATGALEAAVFASEGTTRMYSPNNLANHAGSTLVYEGMAPSEVPVAYYARWEGPVLDASDPYPAKGRSPVFLRAVRHVTDVLFLPARTGPADNAAIKWAVTTYGAVDVAASFHTQEGLQNYDRSTSSYYGVAADELNHHLLIVGWDDAYPASRFLRTPPGDGAFLIKNSWGEDFGDRGYLWLSYHDAGFGRAMAVVSGVAPASDHDAVYQYDALGRSGWWGVVGGGEEAWFANRFVSAGSGDLTAVSFYTPVPGTAYEVRVAGSTAAVAGAPVSATGTAAVAGYHTVPLEQPVAVASGRAFVVAVRVTAPGSDAPVPLERPSRLVSPRARPGQSFVSAEGQTWMDVTRIPGLAKANVCLKAFVDDPTGEGDTARPRVTVRGGVFRSGSKVAIRWRLTDPAFSSASAIVVLAVRNSFGAVVASRRIPAVAVGEQGTWSFIARWTRGTYTVTGRAFDVAGRRQARESSATLVLRAASSSVAQASAAARHP